MNVAKNHHVSFAHRLPCRRFLRVKLEPDDCVEIMPEVNEMKKLAVLGMLVVLTTGCGRGWLPIFRGAPCGTAGCVGAAHTLPPSIHGDCSDCGTNSVGYESYPGEVISGVYDGAVIGGGIINDSGYYGESVAPPMISMPAAN